MAVSKELIALGMSWWASKYIILKEKWAEALSGSVSIAFSNISSDFVISLESCRN